MWITRTSINQPVFATMVMLALVVLGMFSYRLLPVEQMPDITIPQAYVTVAYPGASPEAIENDVIKPLENVINSVDGVKNIYATAREGNAFLMIDFRMEVDIVAATQEVRDKVAQVRSSLPEDVREPTVSRASNDSSTEPVVSLVVYSTTRSLREVSTITAATPDPGEFGETGSATCQEGLQKRGQGDRGEVASATYQEASSTDQNEFGGTAAATAQEAAAKSERFTPIPCHPRGQVQGRPREGEAQRGPYAYPRGHRRSQPRTDQGTQGVLMGAVRICFQTWNRLRSLSVHGRLC